MSAIKPTYIDREYEHTAIGGERNNVAVSLADPQATPRSRQQSLAFEAEAGSAPANLGQRGFQSVAHESQGTAAALRAQLHERFLACDSALISLYPRTWRYGRTAAECKTAHDGRGFADCGDDADEFKRRVEWYNDTWLPHMAALLTSSSRASSPRRPQQLNSGEHSTGMAS
jgi:hypothetical protein